MPWLPSSSSEKTDLSRSTIMWRTSLSTDRRPVLRTMQRGAVRRVARDVSTLSMTVSSRVRRPGGVLCARTHGGGYLVLGVVAGCR